MSDDLDDVAARLRRHFSHLKRVDNPSTDSTQYVVDLAIDRLNGLAARINELEALIAFIGKEGDMRGGELYPISGEGGRFMQHEGGTFLEAVQKAYADRDPSEDTD